MTCRAEPGNVEPPPQQSTPWTAPPTKLPAVVVSAVTELFADGLPDPRGCEYRAIKIPDPWRSTETHGWILPSAPGDSPSAIAWNGAIFAGVEVGAPADLRADFAAMVAESDRRFRGMHSSWGDWDSVRTDSELPIKVAFLLRLSETTLAEDMWDAGYSDEPKQKTADPFADMARFWLGRWYSQASNAYLRGDYARAATVCRRLSPVVDRVKAAAAARGIADPWPDKPGGEYLWQLPTLQADTQRRSTTAPYPSVLERSEPVPPDQRIARLIRELENVDVHQMINPGDTEVIEDPIVKALSKEGDDAVEPLLACLRDDDRLTRSRYTHHLDFGGPIIPVYEGAYTALFRILNVSFPVFEGDLGEPDIQRSARNLSREERTALAAKLEAVWHKKRGLAPEEYAYRTLQDDHAGLEAWFRAIDEIVQPTDGTFTDYRVGKAVVGGMYRVHPSDKPFTPRGESLRSRTDPTVAELIIRRFEQALGEPYNDSFHPPVDQNNLGDMLLSLAAWDGAHCLPQLRTCQQELAARYAHRPAIFNQATLFTLCEKRFSLGDRTALEDYVASLASSTLKDLTDNLNGEAPAFRFLWQHPDEPAIQEAAEKLFVAPDSLFVPFLSAESQKQSGLTRLFKTPLVGMPAFRKELERGLSDAAKTGTVTLHDNDNLGDAPAGSSRLFLKDPLAPPVGSKVGYRVCDAYACLLSQLDGFPECQPYWPEPARDRAVAACREFLRRYGDDFRYHSGDSDSANSFAGVAAIRFPKLDHPATADDVAAGRAIFSLLPGEVRLCRVPKLPQYARRPGRKMDPTPAVSDLEDGSSEETVGYTTEGNVWQAEEVLMDGKWQRFYGFVGRHQMEKAPAAEIEFGGWGIHVSAGITGRIEGPISHQDNWEVGFEYYTRDFAAPDQPLPVTVKLRNGSGLDAEVPAAFAPAAAGSRTLPPGFKLAVAYSEKIPPHLAKTAEPMADYGDWKDLPLRLGVQTVAEGTPGPVLGPTEEITLASVDLRDCFDVIRPGSYRVKGLFHAPGQPERESDETIFSVDQPVR